MRSKPLLLFAVACSLACTPQRPSPAKAPSACGELGAKACLARGRLAMLNGDFDLSRAIAESLCQKEQADGCELLGDTQTADFAAVEEASRIHDSYQRAATLGNKRALGKLAHFVAINGVTKNVWTAAREGCEHKDLMSCHLLDKLAASGLRPADDTFEVPNYQARLRQQCSKKDGAACRLLGWIDLDSARANWRKACDLGETRACFELAGLGLATPDIFAAGCKQGLDASCFYHHKMLDQSTPVIKSACSRKNMGIACMEAGIRYGTGAKGAEKSQQKAYEYYKQACKRGVLRACVRAARLLQHGLGVAKDEATAAAAYEAYCSRSIFLYRTFSYLQTEVLGTGAEACRNAAFVYAHGVGIKKDERKAQGFLKAVCMFTGKCGNYN